MTTRIDDYLSARFQACCLNYNHYIKNLFGEEWAIDKHLSFSLQFSSLSEEHTKQLRTFEDLPKNIATYIGDFDEGLEDDVFNDPKYSYRVLYVRKTANAKGSADRVIEFISADSPEAEGINKEYRVVRDREKPKFLPNEILKRIQAKGYKAFGMHQHTSLWKALDGKNPKNNYGVMVANVWYWYETWVQAVENHCKQMQQTYK